MILHMKKFFYFLFMAGSLTILSCVKESSKEDAPATRTIEFIASTPDSKAVFGEKTGSAYPVSWTSNDVAPAIVYNSEATIFQTSDFTQKGTSARFTWAVPEGAESYYFTAVSPFSALKSYYDGRRLNVDIPSAQTCTATSPDENAIILYARTDSYAADELPGSLNLNFGHITAYLHLSFSNLNLGDGESVQSVSIEAGDLKIAGRMFFYTDTKNTGVNSMVGAISVTTDQIHDVWVALAPVDLSDENVSFIIHTDSKTYTKSVTFPANRSLSSGRVAKLTVDMTGIEGTSPVEYRLVSDEGQLSVNDEIIIVAANFDYAMSTAQNANNRGYTGITKDENSIWSPSSAVQRITLVDGIVPGEYALKTGDDAYLRFESGGNYLRTGNTIDTNSSWYIDIDNTTDTRDGVTAAQNIAFIQEKTDGRFIRFNSNIFSAYVQSSGTSYVRIYRKVQEPAPSFKVTGENGTLTPVMVDNTAQSIPVYVFGNVSWTANVDNGASVDYEIGTGARIININIPKNSSSGLKEYNVTINTTSSITPNSYSLTIKQYPVAVGDIIWSETWEGAVQGTKPADYLANTDHAGTYVFSGANISYSVSDNAFIYDTSNTTSVYYASADEYNSNKRDGDKPYQSFRITKSTTWTVSGIPIPVGVKSAKLKYRCNRNGEEYNASSMSTGVSIGTLSRTSNLYYKFLNGVSSTKAYTLYEYDINFTDAAGDYFEIVFSDTHASNHVYIADIELIITDLE